MTYQELRAFSLGYNVSFLNKNQHNPYDKSKCPRQWHAWVMGNDRGMEVVNFHSKKLHRRANFDYTTFGMNYNPEKWL